MKKNEVAVAAFLKKRIPFTGIAKVVEETMQQHDVRSFDSLEEILAIDQESRRAAELFVRSHDRTIVRENGAL